MVELQQTVQRGNSLLRRKEEQLQQLVSSMAEEVGAKHQSSCICYTKLSSSDTSLHAFLVIAEKLWVVVIIHTYNKSIHKNCPSIIHIDFIDLSYFISLLEMKL